MNFVLNVLSKCYLNSCFGYDSTKRDGHNPSSEQRDMGAFYPPVQEVRASLFNSGELSKQNSPPQQPSSGMLSAVSTPHVAPYDISNNTRIQTDSKPQTSPQDFDEIPFEQVVSSNFDDGCITPIPGLQEEESNSINRDSKYVRLANAFKVNAEESILEIFAKGSKEAESAKREVEYVCQRYVSMQGQESLKDLIESQQLLLTIKSLAGSINNSPSKSATWSPNSKPSQNVSPTFRAPISASSRINDEAVL